MFEPIFQQGQIYFLWLINEGLIIKVTIILYVLFLIGFVVSCASTQTPDSDTTNEANIKKLKQLGRKELIRRAAEKVRSGDNTFNPENFDRIKVFASKHTIYVSFDMSFKYLPQNSKYMHSATVDLYKSDNNSGFRSLLSIASTIESNPVGYRSKKEAGFFSPTEDSRKAIDFILNTMNKIHKDGFYAKKTLPLNHEMIIRDKNDHYQIEERSTNTEGYYSIKKKSGEIFDENHCHISRNPLPIKLKGFEEKFEEIKD